MKVQCATNSKTDNYECPSGIKVKILLILKDL